MPNTGKKVPALAPLDVPRLLCQECGSLLRMQVVVQNNHKISAINAFCDSCQYCFKMSTPHGIGEIVAGGYRAPTSAGVHLEETIEVVGMGGQRYVPAPQPSNADDPRLKPPSQSATGTGTPPRNSPPGT